ncbi:uncharacterized protein LOC141670881 isoform X2 [Apium graveolens]|uniref:uncharacterized protein LOC141670881 isoform X2 n=1 Tax=Apium graveolens TaxID=4045 RepID=UPI003D7975BC
MEDKDSSNSNDSETLSHHLFGNSSDIDLNESFSITITIIENVRKDDQYGMFVWPCSIVLAEYVWQHRSRFSAANVIELGAGTSLPGLVAAKLGSNVTLTDDLTRPEVVGLTWGLWDHPVFNLHPDIILGADVLYDTSAFDDLFATVTFLLQNSPGSVFITTYHNRSGHHLIEFLMVKWGLKCAKLLDGFSFMPSSKTHALSGNIQLAEIILGES